MGAAGALNVLNIGTFGRPGGLHHHVNMVPTKTVLWQRQLGQPDTMMI